MPANVRVAGTSLASKPAVLAQRVTCQLCHEAAVGLWEVRFPNMIDARLGNVILEWPIKGHQHRDALLMT